MQFNSLEDVFVEQIADLRSAEQQLVEALPKMASATSNRELREAFEHHLDQTRNHLTRIQEIVTSTGLDVPNEECKAMKGLISEGEEIISATGNGDAKDAALIAAAQRVEHYEIAAYGTAKTLAKQLDMGDSAHLLDETLDEESEADKLLTKIATGGLVGSGINQSATR